jgi:uncharacterized protein YukJ
MSGVRVGRKVAIAALGTVADGRLTGGSGETRRGRQGMARLKYGVLKGHVAGDPWSQAARHSDDVHFHLHVEVDTGGRGVFDVAVNVGTNNPDDLLMYTFCDTYVHQICQTLNDLPLGYTALEELSKLPALDFIRSDVIPTGRAGLSKNQPVGDDDPENTEPYRTLAALAQGAAAAGSPVYVFGHPYDTGMGVHDVHMNQGSSGSYTNHSGGEHNETWEDGAVLIQFRDRWVALFTAFSGQEMPTDDVTGDPSAGAVPLGG